MRIQYAFALSFAALAGGCDSGLTSVPTELVAMPDAPLITLGSSKDCKDDRGLACDGDRAPHPVRQTGFLMEKTEVTRLQYQECFDKGICPAAAQVAFDADSKNLPVAIDDPDSAARYCEWRGRRLPTEAEFEYAARWSGGAIHDYPWGDAEPTCDQVNHRGCGAGTTGALAAVGTNAFDVNGVGIHDLAGSLPEWVADFYHPHFGCTDRLGYADLCGDDANCPEARCTTDGKACFRGCQPDAAESGDVPLGEQVTAAAVCQLAPNAALPIYDPIDNSPSSVRIVRGGGALDRGCTLAGYARRHAAPKKGYYAGFRCVSQRPALAPSSYRFTLTGCPSPTYPVKITVTAPDGKPYAFELHDWPALPGAMVVPALRDGVAEHQPCGDVFVVLPRDAGDFKVAVSDYQGCVSWATSKNIINGGDVPVAGPEALSVVGGDEATCKVANGPANCTHGACQTSCTTAWFSSHQPDTGFRDCNSSFLDGCEIDIQHDGHNCGACGHVCPTVYKGTLACLAGACQIQTCDGTQSDCDLDPATGCEVNLANDERNCGACRAVCSANHIASPTCQSGACSGVCDPGWGDCNGDKLTDGCEKSLRTNSDCGACGAACANGKTCINGSCA